MREHRQRVQERLVGPWGPAGSHPLELWRHALTSVTSAVGAVPAKIEIERFWKERRIRHRSRSTFTSGLRDDGGRVKYVVLASVGGSESVVAQLCKLLRKRQYRRPWTRQPQWIYCAPVKLFLSEVTLAGTGGARIKGFENDRLTGFLLKV